MSGVHNDYQDLVQRSDLQLKVLLLLEQIAADEERAQGPAGADSTLLSFTSCHAEQLIAGIANVCDHDVLGCICTINCTAYVGLIVMSKLALSMYR